MFRSDSRRHAKYALKILQKYVMPKWAKNGGKLRRKAKYIYIPIPNYFRVHRIGKNQRKSYKSISSIILQHYDIPRYGDITYFFTTYAIY